MSTVVLDDPTIHLPEGYPFHIGYRYKHSVDTDGGESWEKVPLTEEDFLHPQEGDQFVATLDQSRTVQQLIHAISFAGRGRTVTATFGELRIDWQITGLRPHQPDVIVFDHLPPDLPSTTATLTVIDHGLAPVAIFEVTSPETRHIDLGDKFDEYRLAKVPIYLVIDMATPNDVPVLLGFELRNGEYREMPEDPQLGFWVPGLDLWFRLQNDALVVADRDGGDIPNSAETGQLVEGLAEEIERVRTEAEAEAARAQAAEMAAKAQRDRAEEEKARAEAAEKLAAGEKTRADAEKARADELARELAELKARLASNG